MSKPVAIFSQVPLKTFEIGGEIIFQFLTTPET